MRANQLRIKPKKPVNYKLICPPTSAERHSFLSFVPDRFSAFAKENCTYIGYPWLLSKISNRDPLRRSLGNRGNTSNSGVSRQEKLSITLVLQGPSKRPDGLFPSCGLHAREGTDARSFRNQKHIPTYLKPDQLTRNPLRRTRTSRAFQLRAPVGDDPSSGLKFLQFHLAGRT